MILHKKAIKDRAILGTTENYPPGSESTVYNKKYKKKKDVTRMAYIDEIGTVGLEPNKLPEKKAKLVVVSNTLRKI